MWKDGMRIVFPLVDFLSIWNEEMKEGIAQVLIIPVAFAPKTLIATSANENHSDMIQAYE